MNLNHILKAQKDFFLSESSKTVDFRKQQLEKLYGLIEEYEKRIYYALYKDLDSYYFFPSCTLFYYILFIFILIYILFKYLYF